jgi:hypothetical protein
LATGRRMKFTSAAIIITIIMEMLAG